MENSWLQQLEADQIVLIDGATGTELERRGVPMDEIAWSGAAVLTHPDDHIRALRDAMPELEAARSA